MKRWAILVASVVLLSAAAFGQDLGSSNGLFGSPKSKSSSTKTTKKAPAKTTPPVAKAKTPPKKSTPPPKNTKPSGSKSQAKTTAKPKGTQSGKAKPAKVETSTGQPKSPPAESSAVSNERFEELIDDGNDARDDRNYSAAEAAYKRAKAVKPRDSRAVYGLGNLYSDQQRWEDAENAYRIALQLEPNNATAHIALSYVLTQPIAAPNLSERYEEAEKLARRAIQLAPSNALSFDQLGVAMELRGLIGPETENAYRKAIQLNSTFAPAYAHLGRLLRRRGLTKESAAEYKNAIQRSTNVPTMILVADVMQSEQRFAESEQLLRSALNADPKNPSALLMLGRALIAQAKYTDAEQVLRATLNINPNTFVANSLLGTVYFRQGNLELAENALMQAARFVTPLEKRSLAQQFEGVGDAYMKTPDLRNAERCLRQAIALDAENEGLAVKLAKAQRGS